MMYPAHALFAFYYDVEKLIFMQMERCIRKTNILTLIILIQN